MVLWVLSNGRIKVMHILMVAAENGALPGGKVGGLGDVIRDVPLALARLGHSVSVITPGYGKLADTPSANLITEVDVLFCGRREPVTLFSVSVQNSHPQVRHWVLEHWLFAAGGVGAVYSNDHYGPFATDAHKFALFSAAVGQLINSRIIDGIDILHCHDWHSAPLLILRQYSKHYLLLRSLHAVFSIHNLAIQGVRPMQGDDSSLLSWFPDLVIDSDNGIQDPRDSHLVNLMRAGINLADRVHTVSPTYAKEILQASNPEQGFIGGEGLEYDLGEVNKQGRLFGILNGCDYNAAKSDTPSRAEVLKLIDSALQQWSHNKGGAFRNYYFALRRLQQWQRRRTDSTPVLASVARVTAQKFKLLTTESDGTTVLESLLQKLQPGLLIILGNGDADYENFFTDVMASNENFLYLSGYSDALSAALYSFADLYLMPSLFEPCGISQMLAMREGTPCLVHGVGGLKDTVVNGKNGFAFSGTNLAVQGENLLSALETVLTMFKSDPITWQALCQQAAEERFSWDKSVTAYCKCLYDTNRSTADRWAGSSGLLK